MEYQVWCSSETKDAAKTFCGAREGLSAAYRPHPPTTVALQLDERTEQGGVSNFCATIHREDLSVFCDSYSITRV